MKIDVAMLAIAKVKNTSTLSIFFNFFLCFLNLTLTERMQHT